MNAWRTNQNHCITVAPPSNQLLNQPPPPENRKGKCWWSLYSSSHIVFMKSTQYAIRSSALIYSNIIPLKFTVTSYRKKKAILSVLLYEEINKTCTESFLIQRILSCRKSEKSTISIKVEHFRKANVNKGTQCLSLITLPLFVTIYFYVVHSSWPRAPFEGLV